MIRPDVELIRSIANTVATQEGRRGGSVSAHTLALETKTLAAYVEHLEETIEAERTEIERLRAMLLTPDQYANFGSQARLAPSSQPLTRS